MEQKNDLIMEKVIFSMLVFLFTVFAYGQNGKNVDPKTSVDCLNGDCENGYGSKKYGDKIFVGFFENGKPDGPGTLYNNGYVLMSTWKNGINKGYGIINDNLTGNVGHGYFENFLQNGKALRKEKGKTKYGKFSNGTVMQPEFTMYATKQTVGCIEGDCTQKYGMYKFSSDNFYIGFFKDGNPEAGVFSDHLKNRFNGEFVNGKLEGLGNLDFANRDFYFGFFKNGMRHGKGVYFIREAPGKEIAGIWANDKLIKNLSNIQVNPNSFSPTPKGPGIASYIDHVEKSNEVIQKKETPKKATPKKEEPFVLSDYVFNDLGFGDPLGILPDKNNTKDIAKIYPGYNGSNKDFLAAEILKAARKFVTPELQNYTLLKKIEELYAINKRVSYEVFIQLPTSSVMELEKYVSSEIFNYYRAESKK